MRCDRVFINLLHDAVDEMILDKMTFQIINKAEITEKLITTYQLGDIAKNSLTIDDHHLYSIHLAIKNVPIVELFYTLVWNDDYTSAIRTKMPVLSYQQIEGTLFSIVRLLDSFRLDIREEISEENWYLRHHQRLQLMINKSYFLESLKNYIVNDDLSNVFAAYLAATSASSTGGLQTIKCFDVKVNDDQLQLIIHKSDVTYLAFLEVLQTLPATFEVLLENYSINGFTKDDIQLLFDLITRYFTSLVISKKAVTADKYLMQIPDNKIGRRLHYQDIIWQNMDDFKFYERCSFLNVDFSNFELNSDFIDCEFIGCDFTNTTIEDYGCIVRFPILKSRFIDCINFPNDEQFSSLF